MHPARARRPRRAALCAAALAAAVWLLAAPALAGPEPAEDRLDRFNRSVDGFNYWLLQSVIEPVAKGYNVIVPKLAQDAVANVMTNLARPRDIVNSLLQAKPERAARHLAAFVVNSTLGLGGLLYVSDRALADDSPETFSETLGVWRVPLGPYVILPVLSETSPRHLVGLLTDAAMNPLFWIPGVAGTAASAGSRVVGGINTVATLMPTPWASESEWRAFEDLFAQRTPYPEMKRLFRENQRLDVDD